MKFSRDQIEQIIRQEIAVETKTDGQSLDASADLASQGLDSLSCIYVLYQVEKKLDRELNPSIFWDFPTIETLATHLYETQESHG